MVELDKIKVGDKLWYMVLEVSWSKGRLNKKISPVEIEVKEIDQKRWRSDSIKVYWKIKNKEHTDWVTQGNLYKTKEEAIEEWNRTLYNAIDWVESEREKKIANLKKNIIGRT